jgi:hypothetical protein
VRADARDAYGPPTEPQFAEHAMSGWERSDPSARRGVDARGDETGERCSRFVEHAEGSVPGPGQLPGRLDQALEHALEIEVGEHPARGVQNRPRRWTDRAHAFD